MAGGRLGVKRPSVHPEKLVPGQVGKRLGGQMGRRALPPSPQRPGLLAQGSSGRQGWAAELGSWTQSQRPALHAVGVHRPPGFRGFCKLE